MAVTTEEANDRYVNGDRSLSHRATLCVRAPQGIASQPCMSTIDCTLCVIDHTRESDARDLFRSSFPLFPPSLSPTLWAICTCSLNHLHSQPSPPTSHSSHTTTHGHRRPSHSITGHYILPHRTTFPFSLISIFLSVTFTYFCEFLFLFFFLTTALCCTECGCPLCWCLLCFVGGFEHFWGLFFATWVEGCTQPTR